MRALSRRFGKCLTEGVAPFYNYVPPTGVEFVRRGLMKKLLLLLVVLVGLGFVLGCAATTEEGEESAEKNPAVTEKTEQPKAPAEQPKTEPKKEEQKEQKK